MQAARNHPRCGGRDARFVGNGAISAVGFARERRNPWSIGIDQGFCVVRERGVEPPRPCRALAPEASASAIPPLAQRRRRRLGNHSTATRAPGNPSGAAAGVPSGLDRRRPARDPARPPSPNGAPKGPHPLRRGALPPSSTAEKAMDDRTPEMRGAPGSGTGPGPGAKNQVIHRWITVGHLASVKKWPCHLGFRGGPAGPAPRAPHPPAGRRRGEVR